MDAHAEAIVNGVHLESLLARIRLGNTHEDAWEEAMVYRRKSIKNPLTIVQILSFVLAIGVPTDIASVDIEAVAPTPAMLEDKTAFSLSRNDRVHLSTFAMTKPWGESTQVSTISSKEAPMLFARISAEFRAANIQRHAGDDRCKMRCIDYIKALHELIMLSRSPTHKHSTVDSPCVCQ